MYAPFSVSRFAAVSATLVWTLGWVASACVGVGRVATTPDAPAFLVLGVAALLTACGCWVLTGLVRGGQGEPAEGREEPEPWSRRITGWLTGLFWSGCAVVWNIGTITWLVRAADEGDSWVMLVLIPWSLVGWFLLLVLFTWVGTLLGSLLAVLCRARCLPKPPSAPRP